MADQSELGLQNAIERLYRTFAGYRAEHMHGCPHCVSDADHARLYSKPLRDLQPADLDRYAFKAITTWGDTEDFRHFLPRMLELLARYGENEGIDAEQIFAKLDYADWGAWPAAEREAIAGFFDALWLHVVEHFPHVVSAQACLLGLGRTHGDIAGQLAAWRIAASRPAARHFAQFVAAHPIHWSRRRGLSPDGLGWKDCPAGGQFVRWLLDPTRRSDVEAAFFAFAENEEDAIALSAALQDVASLHPV
jgi:hypothetical protein